jgi:hypothetical protein
MAFEKTHLFLAVIGAVAGVASLAYSVQSGWVEIMFSGKNDRFHCAERSDTENGGKVWMVMYRNDKVTKPWLKMVNSFGEDYNTQKRCDVISQRLEIFRQDGLLALNYRVDPKIPDQPFICAKTKLSGDNCELLVTLTRGANGYESLRKMTEALRNGTVVEQSSGSTALPPLSPSSPEVNLQNMLAKEDVLARSPAGQ